MLHPVPPLRSGRLRHDPAWLIPKKDRATPARITNGDTWLHDNLDAYAQWAKTHNSLLNVTAD